MTSHQLTGYRVAQTAGQSGVTAAMHALRAACFATQIDDADPFDEICTHVTVTDSQTDRIVAGFRMLDIAGGAALDRSYSAQFYDLTRLHSFNAPMLEIGRFCVHPDCPDAEVLRAAWGAITAHVDRNNIGLLFGCSSFKGVAPDPYLDAFALLKARYLAPDALAPMIKSRDVFDFANQITALPDIKLAQAQLPPLLRSYLGMGGWVSDHAVIDRDLQTLHVFTGVDVTRIPQARKRVLRALVG